VPASRIGFDIDKAGLNQTVVIIDFIGKLFMDEGINPILLSINLEICSGFEIFQEISGLANRCKFDWSKGYTMV
jgi:hypothetical protein